MAMVRVAAVRAATVSPVVFGVVPLSRVVQMAMQIAVLAMRHWVTMGLTVFELAVKLAMVQIVMVARVIPLRLMAPTAVIVVRLQTSPADSSQQQDPQCDSQAFHGVLSYHLCRHLPVIPAPQRHAHHARDRQRTAKSRLVTCASSRQAQRFVCRLAETATHPSASINCRKHASS
jgi:hypothetical protein